MKLTPSEKHVIDRMAPGALCGEGFLGRDPRPLADIIAADTHAVEALGLTHAQIAARLDETLQVAQAALGTPVVVGETLSAVSADAMGPIPCPWGGCGVFAKGDIELTDLATGQTVRFTPLSVHLIAHHAFYQGKGSRYRLDPADLAHMLHIAGDAG